jgi:hypothetical protein
MGSWPAAALTGPEQFDGWFLGIEPLFHPQPLHVVLVLIGQGLGVLV